VVHDVQISRLMLIFFLSRCISAVSMRESLKRFFFSKQLALVDFHTISRNTTSKYALNDDDHDDDSDDDDGKYDDGQ